MADLSRAILAHRQLVAQIRAAFPDVPEEDLADSIEGATDLDDAIAAVIREALAREAMAKGIDEFAAKLADRKGRLLNGASTLRAAARTAMEEIGLSRVLAPDFTASLTRGRPRVLILDPKAVPAEFLRQREPEPDKTAIGDKLKAGEQVAGCELSNAGLVLNVRVS